MASRQFPGRTIARAAALFTTIVVVLPFAVMPSRPASKSSSRHCAGALPADLPTRQWSGTEVAMVPGRPRELLACRYHGAQPPWSAGSLAASTPLPAEQIAIALNDAPVRPAVQNWMCKIDTGEAVLLVFGYPPGHPRLLVRIETSGCGFADNGARTVMTPPALEEALRDALGVDRPAQSGPRPTTAG